MRCKQCFGVGRFHYSGYVYNPDTDETEFYEWSEICPWCDDGWNVIDITKLLHARSST